MINRRSFTQPTRKAGACFVLKWTGRKSGILSLITDNWLKPAAPELKRVAGQELNKLKAHIEGVIEERRVEIEAAAEKAAQAREQIDLSLPGVERAIGTRHLIRQTYEELQRIFLSIGFSVVEGPEIETPYYNFEALNIPEHHPARDNMDTFYIEGARGGHLLRTHTSPMQIRTMEKQAPPVRIIVPGKVYRRDNPDATHGYMFHQIEGLAVDTDITFCDFKGTVEYFVREFLGPQAKTRLRPSYFPFTEPSAEVDATCHVCGGSGCRVCKFSGLDRAVRRGDGGPRRLRLREIRRGEAFRLRLRDGRRPARDDEIRHQRAADPLPERRALPEPISVEKRKHRKWRRQRSAEEEKALVARSRDDDRKRRKEADAEAIAEGEEGSFRCAQDDDEKQGQREARAATTSGSPDMVR